MNNQDKEQAIENNRKARKLIQKTIGLLLKSGINKRLTEELNNITLDICDEIFNLRNDLK